VKRPIGISTWVWESPLTDSNLGGHLARIAALGFDAVELPLENAGDFTSATVREAVESTGLTPFLVGAMAPGRDLVSAAPASVERTQAYLMECISMASSIGSPTVCGPFYAQTGRVWRMSPGQRREAYAELRHNLQPVADRAREAGVILGVEPLNRYETSLINTVDQALEALEPLLGNGVGLALDSYHLHIEERSLAAAVRAAGEHLVHVQVCGNDRGAPGGDQTDWQSFLHALDEVGYTGPLNIESFTADNAAIAVAASIWRPLAPSQDELAASGLAFLRGV
jgi:D-psicose/D-tagatose/L-ribulose 3-epimerase